MGICQHQHFVIRNEFLITAKELFLLKLQYFGHLMQRADSLEKTLMLAKIEGRRRGAKRMKWLDGITDSIDMNLSKLQEMAKDGEIYQALTGG